MRGSRGAPSLSGKGAGLRDSYQRSASMRGSAAIVRCSMVVPVRGSPTITSGRSIRAARISGWRAIQSSLRRRFTRMPTMRSNQVARPMAWSCASSSSERSSRRSGSRKAGSPNCDEPGALARGVEHGALVEAVGLRLRHAQAALGCRSATSR